jgi:O-antigen/teichoic acid export membrane protein
VRFAVTLVANGLRTALSLLTWLIIARAMGANGYGDLTFLLGSFAAINLLLDLGTAHAFHTKVSARPRGAKFFLVYLAWTVGVQWGLTALVIGLVLPGPMFDRVWLGHDRVVVLLALTATFLMSQLWTMVSQMGEALRRTVQIQTAAVIQAATHFALVAAAIRGGWLSLVTVLWLTLLGYLAIIVALGPRLLKANIAHSRAAGAHAEEIGAIIREFAVFCRPLAVFGTIGVAYMFADRWLLQRFGGSRQQGLFSIGQQIATVSLLATTAIMDVFWKEIAEARERGDTARATVLYTAVRHALFFYTAWISCGVIPHVDEVLAWTVGADFAGAWLPLTIMLFYPIHQSLSLVQGTFAYASGKPTAYTRAGILTMVISIPITYLLLAPHDAAVPGLGLGAVGLSLKLVVLQILGVVLAAHVLVRDNEGWSHDYAYQVKVLASLVILGFATRWIVEAALIAVGLNAAPLAVGLAALLYTAACAAVVYYVPSAAGLTRAQIEHAITFPARWRFAQAPR